MPQYLVKWEIDIEADSPKEAAYEAWKIQQRHDSEALVFDVVTQATGKEEKIDLLEEVSEE